MKFLGLLTYLFAAVLIFTAALEATGPSSARVEIVPVAENAHGVILFKTRSHINRSGAHSLLGVRYGWLCVSASGLWEEGLHEEATTANSETAPMRLQSEFDSPVDLENLPKSLTLHLTACGDGPWTSVEPHSGQGRARWEPGAFCLDDECRRGAFRQRSLDGLTSRNDLGTPIDCTFFHRGVALFSNVEGFEKNAGALFEIENIVQRQEVGIYESHIAALVVRHDSAASQD